MANTFLTPATIARVAYANLIQAAVAVNLVHRDYEADFAGAVGDTVTIRKPATFTANTFNRTTGIVLQNATEGGITVTLDTILDVSFAVTAEDLTLEIADFNTQLLKPATDAIATGLEKKVLALRADVVQSVGAVAGEELDDPRVLIAAGRELNKKNVPAGDRATIAGPVTSAEWLKDPLFHEADKLGSTVGLQEATIGRKFGFDNYQSTNIEGPTEESLAFHKTAFALVTRTLALPKGNSNAAAFGGAGLGIRVVQDYDISKKQDVISLDVLCGTKTLDPNRAVIVQQV